MSERQFRVASVLVVCALLALGLAVVTWYLPVQGPGGRCGRAIDFHFGHTGYHQGGDVDRPDRPRRLAVCRTVVAGHWYAGLALVGAAAAGVAVVTVLVVRGRDWMPGRS